MENNQAKTRAQQGPPLTGAAEKQLKAKRGALGTKNGKTLGVLKGTPKPAQAKQ